MVRAVLLAFGFVALFMGPAQAQEPAAPDEEAFDDGLPDKNEPAPQPLAEPVPQRDPPAAEQPPAPVDEPPQRAPPVEEPAPSSPPPSSPAPDGGYDPHAPDGTQHSFMDDSLAFGMQYATGVAASFVCCGGAGLVGGVVGVVLFVIPGGVIWSTLWLMATGCPSALLAPAGGVSIGVWLREWWGGMRSAWAWSLLAAYATELAAIAVLGVGTLSGALLTTPFFGSIFDFEQQNPINPPAQWNWTSLAGGGALAIGAFSAGLIAAILAPSLSAAGVYSVLGEEKAEDDTGFRIPGLFSPNPPEPGNDEDEEPTPRRRKKRDLKAPRTLDVRAGRPMRH